MSKKQLKNLVLKDELENENNSEDDESGEDVAIPSKRVNKFALLEDSDEASEVEKDVESEPEVQPSAAEKKKKKKKNNKKKNKQQGQVEEADDEGGEKPGSVKGRKEKALERMAELLKITYTDLNFEAELKKILGPAFRPPTTQQHRGGKSARKMPSYRIIQKKPEWPSAFNSGITVAPDVDGPKVKEVKYIRFEHNPGYKETQQMFWDIAEHAAPNFQTILELSPFHLDTLIIMAEQLAQHDAHESRNLTEFAIYICESALPNGFETLSAYTRFDYNWRENRAFFLLLFKHLKFLIKRRCFLTALNVAKLILLKDPSDPLGMHLIVDALSLKSGQHKFLLDYYEHFKVSHVDDLPNMKYSIAFAHHFLAIENDDPDLEMIAQNLLFEAITSFPSILFNICDEMNMKPTPSVTNALQVFDIPKGLELICRTYVAHNLEDIWKKDGFMNWIEGSVETMVTERVTEVKEKIKKLKDKYKKIYVGVPDAIARHAYLFELHSCFNGIPSIDPFPPSQHRSGYEKRQHPDGREVGGQEVASGEEREGVRNQFLGMVGQMFESLDPRYNNQNNANGEGAPRQVPGVADMMREIGRMWIRPPANDDAAVADPEENNEHQLDDVEEE